MSGQHSSKKNRRFDKAKARRRRTIGLEPNVGTRRQHKREAASAGLSLVFDPASIRGRPSTPRTA